MTNKFNIKEKEFYEHIRQNPGIRLSELTKHFGYGKSRTYYWIHRLIDRGMITTKNVYERTDQEKRHVEYIKIGKIYARFSLMLYAVEWDEKIRWDNYDVKLPYSNGHDNKSYSQVLVPSLFKYQCRDCDFKCVVSISMNAKNPELCFIRKNKVNWVKISEHPLKHMISYNCKDCDFSCSITISNTDNSPSFCAKTQKKCNWIKGEYIN